MSRAGYVRSGITLGMLALAAVTARPHDALAVTITLESSSAGVYDYGVVFAGSEIVNFAGGETLTISGLSGVTGQSVTGDLSLFGVFEVDSFTSTSATFEAPGGRFENGQSGNTTLGTLVIDSSVLTTGAASYTLETASDNLTGDSTRPSEQHRRSRAGVA